MVRTFWVIERIWDLVSTDADQQWLSQNIPYVNSYMREK